MIGYMYFREVQTSRHFATPYIPASTPWILLYCRPDTPHGPLISFRIRKKLSGAGNARSLPPAFCSYVAHCWTHAARPLLAWLLTHDVAPWTHQNDVATTSVFHPFGAGHPAVDSVAHMPCASAGRMTWSCRSFRESIIKLG